MDSVDLPTRGKVVAVVFKDFKEAFDVVPTLLPKHLPDNVTDGDIDIFALMIPLPQKSAMITMKLLIVRKLKSCSSPENPLLVGPLPDFKLSDKSIFVALTNRPLSHHFLIG